MPPSDRVPLDLVDQLEEFDHAWRTAAEPDLAAFLPPPGDPGRRAALVELIMIDLEYRWRRGSQPPATVKDGPHRGADRPLPWSPLVEDYLARFGELGDPPLELIGEEYRVRQRWGDRPAHAEFASRFPRHGVPLHQALARIDAELAAEPARPAPLACPHCHQPLGPAGDAGTCPACGEAFRVEPPAARPPVPRVGRYELVALVGTGAFGTVWRGWDTALAREVAVKLPRTGRVAGAEEVERFLREARSTAQLQHPGIVPLHDTGRDGDLVYLVSDLIDGVGMDAWLRGRRVPFRVTAELVAQLADALDYAHRQGVVHRDVKPSNVLLGSRVPPGREDSRVPEGRDYIPKITDFGLAKRDAGETRLTLDGHVVGTPAYMSPEQIDSAHAVDGRADVYSLGVILYELLTGELPFRGTTRMVLDQALRDDPRPPRRLNDKVPRDLETVCLKCLQKEPGRRYATAADLAADLRRWLAGEPILARPIGRVGRAWRWCLRNPKLASVSASLLVAVAVGSVGVLSQWRRAEAHRRYDEASLQAALDVMDTYITQVSQDPRLLGHDLEALRKELLRSALPFYREFVTQRPDNPRLREARARAHARLGYLTGQTGDRAEAVGHFQEALATFARLAAAEPAVEAHREELGRIHNDLGEFYRGHALAKAEPAFDAALGYRRRLAADRPDQPRYQEQLADTYLNLSNVYAETDRLAQARQPLDDALAIYQALARRQPERPGLVYAQSLCHLSLGLWFRDVGDGREERAEFERAVRLLDALVTRHPSFTSYQVTRAECYKHLGTCHGAARRLPEGEAALTTARDIQRRLTHDHPTIPKYRLQLAETLNNLGNFHKVAGQRDKAEAALLEAVQAFAQLDAEHPGTLDYQTGLGAGYHNLGVLYLEAGNSEKAHEFLLRGHAARKRTAADHPRVLLAAVHLGTSAYTLGRLAARRGDSAAGRDWFAEAIATVGPVVQAEPRNARARSVLSAAFVDRAGLAGKLGRHREALADWDEALRLTETGREELRLARAMTLVHLGDAAPAVTDVDAVTATPAAAAGALYNGACVYAVAAGQAKGDGPLAERYAARAVELLRRAAGRGFDDVGQLHKDADLDALRQRAAFKQLVAELGEKPKGKDP